MGNLLVLNNTSRNQVAKKEEVETKSAAATLPQLLKGFKADKPVWIGGVKKNELGGVFDSGECRRYGIGQELAKAERAVWVESQQKKSELKPLSVKYVPALL